VSVCLPQVRWNASYGVFSLVKCRRLCDTNYRAITKTTAAATTAAQASRSSQHVLSFFVSHINVNVPYKIIKYYCGQVEVRGLVYLVRLDELRLKKSFYNYFKQMYANPDARLEIDSAVTEQEAQLVLG